MNQGPVSIIITIALVALVVWRNSRPQRVTMARFWIAPVILVLLSGFLIYQTLVIAADQGALLAGVVIVGLALGVPLGVARGHHSQVRLTDTPGVFYIDPSMIVMLIWAGAFAVRYGIRFFLPNSGALGLVVGDGFLAFAIASVIAARIMIFRKYEAMRAQAA